jgi:hypothetical protein
MPRSPSVMLRPSRRRFWLYLATYVPAETEGAYEIVLTPCGKALTHTEARRAAAAQAEKLIAEYPTGTTHGFLYEAQVPAEIIAEALRLGVADKIKGFTALVSNGAIPRMNPEVTPNGDGDGDAA